MFPGVFQFAVDSEQHCDIAGGSSDEIGGRQTVRGRTMTTFRKIEKKIACLDLFSAI